jgi:MscS family membrane protein
VKKLALISWEAGVLAALLVGSWFLAWFIRRLVRQRLVAARATGRPVAGLEMGEAAIPLVRWGLLMAAGALALHLFSVPAPFDHWLRLALQAVFTLIVAMVAGRVVATLFQGWVGLALDASSRQSRATLAPLLANAVQIAFLAIALLLVLQNIGYNVAGLIAGLGIGGVAVALAAKDTLANFFGSISLLADRPFAVGDFIRFDAYEGTVERIGLRSTRVRTPDGALVAVPNEKIASVAVSNVSRRETRRQVINLSLDYSLSADQVRQALGIVRAIVAAHPQTEDAWIYFNDFGESGLNVQMTYWCKQVTPREFLAALEEINLEIKAQLDAAGIGLAIPARAAFSKKQGG